MENKFKIWDVVKINESNLDQKILFNSSTGLFLIWNFIEKSQYLNEKWINHFLKNGKKYELRPINIENNRARISENCIYVSDNEIEEVKNIDDETYAMIYDVNRELWKYQVNQILKPKDNTIKYKFKIRDLVYYREKPEDNSPFNEEIENLYMVSNFVKDSVDKEDWFKEFCINEGYLYEIRIISSDYGFGVLGNKNVLVKENQIKFYTGRDNFLLDIYNDVLHIFYEELEQNNTIPKRWDVLYKYERLQPVIYRKNHSLLPFDFDKEPICFIDCRVGDIPNITYSGIDNVLRQGYKYSIFKVYKNDEVLNMKETEYAKEEDLTLYDGNNEEVLNSIKKVYEEIDKRREEYHKRIEEYNRINNIYTLIFDLRLLIEKKKNS